MYARQLIYNANKSLTTLHNIRWDLCFKCKIDKTLTTIYHTHSTQMVIHICYTLAHVVIIYVRRTQILVSLLCPLCMAITLRLCLLKITCEFCYIKRIIRWGLGTTKCEWVLVTSYVDVRSILCCVVIAILVVLDFVELSVKKMWRKKRERK